MDAGIRIRANNSTILLLFCLIFTFLLHISVLGQSINQTSMSIVCIWILVSYFIMGRSIRVVAGGMNFCYIFVLFTALFFFGQQFCYALNLDTSFLPRYVKFLSTYTNSNNVFHGTFYPLECIYVISIIFCFTFHSNVNKLLVRGKSLQRDCSIERRSLHVVSRVLFYVTLVPTLYYYIYAIMANRMFGYSTMKYMLGEGLGRGTLLFWCALASGWFETACYMLWVSSEKKFEARLARVMVIVYAGLIILAGSRYKALEILCAYVLIDFFWEKRNKKIRLALYLILGLIVLVLFSAVRYSRIGAYQTQTSSPFSYQAIGDALLGDSAATSQVNYAVMEYTSTTGEFGYGISYVYGFASVLPSFLRNIVFPEFATDISGDILSAFSGAVNNSLGSSFCAEAFYNFGWFSLALMIIYGCILSIITAVQNTIIGILSPSKFVLYVYLCSQIIFCVRSEVSSLFRPTVYYALIPIMIAGIIKNYKQHISRI